MLVTLTYIPKLIIHVFFAAQKVVSLNDPSGKVLQIIKIWSENLASIDRRIKLLEKMKKIRNAKNNAGNK